MQYTLKPERHDVFHLWGFPIFFHREPTATVRGLCTELGHERVNHTQILGSDLGIKLDRVQNKKQQ